MYDSKDIPIEILYERFCDKYKKSPSEIDDWDINWIHGFQFVWKYDEVRSKMDRKKEELKSKLNK